MRKVPNPMTTDELAEIIAGVELDRQETARQIGNAAACAAAVRKLEKLQSAEKDALRARGPAAQHSANLATLTAEIGKVQKLGGTTNRVSLPDSTEPEPKGGPRHRRS
jgi:hypothetical protein